jgi:lipoprotein NlpI
MLRALLCLLFSVSTLVAAEPTVVQAPPYEDLILQSREAERKGLMGRALEALDKAIALDPKRRDAYFFKGRILSVQRKPDEVIALMTKVVELDPKASSAYQTRGQEEFKLGQIEKSVDDFNKYLELEPQQRPYHWQRGISLYYAGKFALGRQQFELHQTVNPNDVENGVWHFLCAARADGLEKARSSMLPISGDVRIPMTEVYELFKGKISAEDVLAAAKKGDPKPAALENRLFYAHLYIGLYFEALGDPKQSYEHIKLAATDYASDDYMGDVAKVHFKRMIAPPPAK